MTQRCRLCILIICLNPTAMLSAQDTIRIGAKNFTEQEILGELVAQLIERHSDLQVKRSFGLGGTGICHSALTAGEIDLYVEYTGTALLNVLNRGVVHHSDEAFRIVAEAYREQFNVRWLPPIGFNNTYALAVRAQAASKNGWKDISDLADVASELQAGFTGEFIERSDGYQGLKKAYDLEFGEVKDVDSGLMYRALANDEVDVICAFSTDGRIKAYDLRVLNDDLDLFPPYDACPVIRAQILDQHPEIRTCLVSLAGTIDNQTMRDMNYAVDEKGKRPSEVARNWIERRGGPTPEDYTPPQEQGPLPFWKLLIVRRGEVLEKTGEHLVLTVVAVLCAILVAIPIGILTHRFGFLSTPVLAATEIVQTVPSLAMLAFLFAVYGVLGLVPAISALVLYALLPIALNTYTGLKEVAPEIVQAADGMGMSRRQRLWIVELPLALPVIIAGIRASTVWSVGIATLSTFIGAGGLGDFISRGLARNDARLTLLGALPAAFIALALSFVIKRIEKATKKHREA